MPPREESARNGGARSRESRSRLVDKYLREGAEMAPDPFVPELLAYNARALQDLWQLAWTIDAGDSASDAPERRRLNTRLPYWGVVWPGARALARVILDRPEAFHGKRVLDIATGSGLAAIAAAKAGANAVGFDLDEEAAEMAERTARLNNVRCRFFTADALQMAERDFARYDIILAGDVFYEEPFASQMTALLRRLAGRGVVNLVADPTRMHAPKYGRRIVAELRVPCLPSVEGVGERETAVFHLIPE